MIWFEILSELLINIAAAWFAVVFIEPQLGLIHTKLDILWLILKLVAGIISLLFAKYLREKARRK